MAYYDQCRLRVRVEFARGQSARGGGRSSCAAERSPRKSCLCTAESALCDVGRLIATSVGFVRQLLAYCNRCRLSVTVVGLLQSVSALPPERALVRPESAFHGTLEWTWCDRSGLSAGAGHRSGLSARAGQHSGLSAGMGFSTTGVGFPLERATGVDFGYKKLQNQLFAYYNTTYSARLLSRRSRVAWPWTTWELRSQAPESSCAPVKEPPSHFA